MALKSEERLCINRHENETKNSSFINSLETQHSFSFIQSFLSSFTPPSSIFQQCTPLPLIPTPTKQKKKQTWSDQPQQKWQGLLKYRAVTTPPLPLRLAACESKERRATTWNQWHSSFLCKKRKKKLRKRTMNMGCLADTVGVQGVGDFRFKVFLTAQPQN